MHTKEELEAVRKEPNPWEGITYIPSGCAESKFAVAVVESGKRRTIGHFPSLEAAVHGRDCFIQYHANKPTREHATYPQHYETRSIND